MRLAKYLAHAGVASRRASEQLIFSGRVTLDGAVVTDPALDVTGAEAIAVDGEAVGAHDGRRAVYLLHKPPGIVSTAHDTHGRKTVVDMIQSGRRLYPVGRLDVDTTGLILLTDDGALAHRLTHPSFEVPKTYIAKVRGGALREGDLRRLREGVELDDGRTSPAKIKRLAHDELEITIHEGRKRQVRRMCEAIGHPVASLRRVAFGNLRLGTLEEGKYRRLTATEIDRLRGAAAGAVTAKAVRGAIRGAPSTGRRRASAPTRPARRR